MNNEAFFEDLSASEIAHIRQHALRLSYASGEKVFNEGDVADYFYIVERGQFGIYIDKLGQREEISIVGPGDYFGEMAIFNQQNRRLASVEAREDGELLGIDKDMFLKLVRTYPALAEKINKKIVKRSEEFILKESLLDSTGIDSRNLHISIKGDPSLRESAFSRERYESVVDRILPQLQQKLEELLLERSVYRIFLAFNSGEVRVSTVFDPFSEEIHTASKLVDAAYFDRHFPRIDYDEKSRLVRNIYQCIVNDEQFSRLPAPMHNIYTRNYAQWQPVAIADVIKVIGKLSELRDIPSFYLRNISVSMVRNAVRMQFNCDGMHIVSADDYQRFLDENLA